MLSRFETFSCDDTVLCSAGNVMRVRAGSFVNRYQYKVRAQRDANEKSIRSSLLRRI